MFRAQVPPRPLDHALSGFIQILEERFGPAAAMESILREYIVLLNQEIGHPVKILTRAQFDRACERALATLLSRKPWNSA